MGSTTQPVWAVGLSARCGMACMAALTLLAGCGAGGSHAPSPTPTTTASAVAITTTTPAVVAAPPALPASRTEKWIDLQIGDCLADLPPSDPAVVTVSVVDCAHEHAAEVFLRADLEVNAAVADVADHQCGAGLTQYTGQPVRGGPFTVTYLIDSNQDRTSANPLPSTVICLLQSSAGGPLTGSARR